MHAPISPHKHAPQTHTLFSIEHYSYFLQVAYSSGDDSFSNRKHFRNFFHTNPSDASLFTSLTVLLNFYGWKRILFITEGQGAFPEVSS